MKKTCFAKTINLLKKLHVKTDGLHSQMSVYGYEVGEESVGFFHPIFFCRNMRAFIRTAIGDASSLQNPVTVKLMVPDKHYEECEILLGKLEKTSENECLLNCFEGELETVKMLLEGISSNVSVLATRWSEHSFRRTDLEKITGRAFEIREENVKLHGFCVKFVDDNVVEVFSEAACTIMEFVSALTFETLKDIVPKNILLSFVNTPTGLSMFFETAEQWRKVCIFLGFDELLSNPLDEKEGVLLSKPLKKWPFLRDKLLIKSTTPKFDIGEVFTNSFATKHVLTFSVTNQEEAMMCAEKAFYLMGYDGLLCKENALFLNGCKIGQLSFVNLKETVNFCYNVSFEITNLPKQDNCLDYSNYEDHTFTEENDDFISRLSAKEKAINLKKGFVVFLSSFQNKFTFRIYKPLCPTKKHLTYV